MKQTLIFIICICLFLNVQGQTKSSKRGVSFGFENAADMEALQHGTSWFYNWGTNPKNVTNLYSDYGYEFCPMAWNDRYSATEIRNYVNAHPDCKYILAYNEPNLNDQAKMTPQQAAANWPQLKALADELNLKIISPAMNYGTLAGYGDPFVWLDEFFTYVPVSEVHAIAVHCYMSWVGATSGFVGEFINRYKKPVWLTEFCAWDDFKNRNGGTALSQRQYMIEAIDYLENEPMVERYAWFMPRYGNYPEYPWMQLLTSIPGELTETGLIFANMSSYDKNYYHNVDSYIEAEHYISMKGIYMEKTTDESGTINIYDYTPSDTLEYNVNIPESREYTVFLRTASEKISTIEIEVNEKKVDSKVILNTDDMGKWATQQFLIPLSSGKQKIGFIMKAGGFKFNWWCISSNSQIPSGIQSPKAKQIIAYPNPVVNTLFFQLDEPDSKVILTDMTGNKVYENKNARSINMASFAPGMYILNIQKINGEKQSAKIFKR